MLVPRYWAEHRMQLHEGHGPRTTIRRWGWSAVSQAEADAHAHQRAEAVAAEVRAGRKLPLAERRERKVAYNGADGLPIREEVLSEHPDLDAVVTRNAYGAHCLNVRDVLFADVDLEHDLAERDRDAMVGCSSLLLVGGAVFLAMKGWILGAAVVVVVAFALHLHRRWLRRVRRARLESPTYITGRIEAWCREHPAWRIHLYRTPAGYRLLATHGLIDPTAGDALELFQYFAVDPLFVRMCRHQRCFRARLTGKPWRMAIAGRPGHGAWPPGNAAAMARRQEFVARYEAAAPAFAACRHLGGFGGGAEHPRAAGVRRLHDESTRALVDLPLA